MTEKLLQYIWQHQYFNSKDLVTEGIGSAACEVISAGIFNTNQGPDFLEGRVRIEGHTWAGHIELHVKASDWQKHGHDDDVNYKNVILHVVWENDLGDGVYVPPMIELAPRVSNFLLRQYEDWMMSPATIPCNTGIAEVPELVWIKWKERLVIERLQKKTILVNEYLKESKNHWEEVFWWLLAKNFGITVNRESFELIARSLPLTVPARHRENLHQLEAMLFGQANLLVGRFTEDYPAILKKEYGFLKKKYRLTPIFAPVHFLRMRPVNFPTIRLAQLARLLSQQDHLFSKVLATDHLVSLKKLFDVTAGDYWHYHFRFGETSNYHPKKLGAQMIDSLVINTIVPVVFAYGHYHRDDVIMDKALHWLDLMGAEKNRVTSRFYSLGVRSVNAFDTQALYELKSKYCDEKRCLDCAVGNAILR